LGDDGSDDDGLETRRWNGTKSACADYSPATARGGDDPRGRGLSLRLRVSA